MEKKKNKKIAIIVAISIITVIAIAVAAILIYKAMAPKVGYNEPMYTSEDQVYEYFASKTENKYDMSKYSATIDEFLKEMNAPASHDDSKEIILSSENASAELKSVCEEGNKIIITYFEEKYDISVKARLDELKVRQYKNPSDSTAGVYLDKSEEIGSDGKTVYINLSTIESLTEEKWDFLHTYFHEALHYLGAAIIDSDDFENGTYMWFFYSEGIAESLACSILESSEDYLKFCTDENRESKVTPTAYSNVVSLVRQMTTADPEIVKVIFDRNDYATAGEIDRHIDKSEICGEDIAKVTSLVEYQGSNEHRELSQYYVGEYCKSFAPSKETQLKIANYFIAPINIFAK